MRNITAIVALCGLVGFAGPAAAWFIFIPGKLIDAVADSITGAEGEHCVTAGASVGDKIRLPGGGVATVKSVSGTSIRCSNPALPIRAMLDFGDATGVTGSQLGAQPPSTALDEQMKLPGHLRQPVDRPPEHSLSDPFINHTATPKVQPVVAKQQEAPVLPSDSTSAHSAPKGPPPVEQSVASAPLGGANKPVADRLRELEVLRRDGLITPQEYEEKRKRIIDSL